MKKTVLFVLCVLFALSGALYAEVADLSPAPPTGIKLTPNACTNSPASVTDVSTCIKILIGRNLTFTYNHLVSLKSKMDQILAEIPNLKTRIGLLELKITSLPTEAEPVIKPHWAWQTIPIKKETDGYKCLASLNSKCDGPLTPVARVCTFITTKDHSKAVAVRCFSPQYDTAQTSTINHGICEKVKQDAMIKKPPVVGLGFANLDTAEDELDLVVGKFCIPVNTPPDGFAENTPVVIPNENVQGALSSF